MGGVSTYGWPFIYSNLCGPVGNVVAPGPLHRHVRQGAYDQNVFVDVGFNSFLVEIDFTLFHQVPGRAPQGVRGETFWPSEPVSL